MTDYTDEFDITNQVINVLQIAKKIVLFTIEEVKNGVFPFSEIEEDLKYMDNLIEQSRKNKKIDIDFVEFTYGEMLKEIRKAIEKELGVK